MRPNVERISSIDSFKGIGILLVILGHVTLIPEGIQKVIYSFHMPAFFLLSGLMFRRHKTNENNIFLYVKQKFRRLIFPAWLIGALCSIPFLYMLFKNQISLALFFVKLYGTATGYPKVSHNFNCSPIWFLFALFVVESIAIFFAKKIHRRFISILFIVSILSILLSVFYRVQIPFNVMQATSALFFFSVGLLLQDSSIIQSKSVVWLFILFILFSVLQIWATKIDLSINKYGSLGYLPVNLAVALLGTLLLFIIANICNCGFFSWLGKNTILVIGMNYYVNSSSIVASMLKYFNTNNWLINFCIQTIMILLVIIMINYFKSFVRNSIIKLKCDGI